MNTATKALVRQRAGQRCEYCQLRQEDSPLAVLHIEHVIPKKHGGSDDLENLALACIDCNLHKNRSRRSWRSVSVDVLLDELADAGDGFAGFG